MKQTRRSFFKTMSAAGAGLAAGTGTASASYHTMVNNHEVAMLYDATKCVGCKACMAACKRVNTSTGALEYERASFDEDELWDAPEDLSGKTRTIIKLYQDDEASSFVKHSCMHCQKPSCVSACPVKAMVKDLVSGIVDYNKDTCIGCRYCQIACAFNIPKFQWDRSVPQIVKCDMCYSTNMEADGITACAAACPTGAIIFGERGDLLHAARSRIAENPDRYLDHIYGEHEAGGTNHLYLSALPFEKLGLPGLGPEAPAEISERIQHTIYRGFIAPVALYAGLCFVAIRNKNKNGHREPAEDGGGRHET
jgi:Fe-S-cluster-containing dehydrogenase component